MTPDAMRSFAATADNVHNALMTLEWWTRGVVAGASTTGQEDAANRALQVATLAERQSKALSQELARIADELADARAEMEAERVG